MLAILSDVQRPHADLYLTTVQANACYVPCRTATTDICGHLIQNDSIQYNTK